MGYKDNHKLWINNLKEDDPLKAELLAIDDEAEIEDRFYEELSFGTAGLRGKLGAGTNRMNTLTVGRASRGIADFIRSQEVAAAGQEIAAGANRPAAGQKIAAAAESPDGGRQVAAAESPYAGARGVVIARDPRHMSEEFCRLTAGIMASLGIKVYLFDDIRPTPQLAFMIPRLGAICGINITASHNPKDYNGYKVYWEDGCQVSADIADGMSRCISQVDIWKDIPEFDYDELVYEGMITVLDESYDREYLDRIESLARHEGDELDLSIPLVYTPLNGCGAIPFSQMLRDRGFTNWFMVPEQTDPDPDFKTVGYPNPEDPAAFALSKKYGRERGAELLMATDPDADRFAIEVRDPQGNYVPLNGNQTGYLLVNYLLENAEPKDAAAGPGESSNCAGPRDAAAGPGGSSNCAGPRDAADGLKDAAPKGAMVKSIVTSNLSTIICASKGVEMFETLTGFKNICGKIPYLEEHGYQYLFGYEESIGYAPCADIRDKDGISAGMLIAEAAAYYRKQGKSLWDVLQDIYARYGYFAEDVTSIVLDGIPGKERIGRMMKWLRENTPRNICGISVNKVIDYIDGYEDIPAQNALRIHLKNESWFAVRPSGTEPKIKFYFYSKQGSRQEALSVNAAIKKEVLDTVQTVD